MNFISIITMIAMLLFCIFGIKSCAEQESLAQKKRFESRNQEYVYKNKSELINEIIFELKEINKNLEKIAK